MTMHGAFHRNSSVDRLYLKRKEGGRGLISVEDCVKEEKENFSSMCKVAMNGCSRK